MRRLGGEARARSSACIGVSIILLSLTAGSVAHAQRWSDVPSMPTARSFPGAVGLDGKLYVLGGGATADSNNWGPYTHVLEIYDVQRGRWSEGALLPADQVWDPVVEAVGGAIYLIGGFPHQVGVQEYDPRTDTWVRRSSDMSFNGGLWGGNAISGVLDGKIVIANTEWGGVFTYDPETNRMAELDSSDPIRLQSQGGLIDGKVYLAGGLVRPPEFGPAQFTSEVAVYDTATGEWSTVAPMRTERALARAEVVDGMLYVIGGVNGSFATGLEPVDDMEVYDPETDTWTVLPGIPDPRDGFATAVVDGRLYVAGGLLGEAAAADRLLPVVRRFDPETCRRIPPGLAGGAGELHGLPRAVRNCP